MPGNDKAPRNRLLAALPASAFKRMHGELKLMRTDTRDPLWKVDTTIRHVYFPISSVASIIALDGNGGEVEVGTIGNEGIVGLPLFLGARQSPNRAFTQVAGETYRLDAGTFIELARDVASLRNLLHLYTQGFVVQVSQSVACNRLHAPEQRLARWLLSCADRVGSDRFPLTQEFMGQMLGVRRATVGEAARALQERGLIQYSRGNIHVVDRPGLMAAACECYMIVRQEYDRLLGKPHG